MRVVRSWTLPVLSSGLLLACSAPNMPPDSALIRTVRGQSIPPELFAYYARQRSGVSPEKLDPAVRAALLKDLMRLKAAALAGAKVHGTEWVQAVELARLEILAKEGATAAGVYGPLTDGELRSEYQQFVANWPASEYHVAHILVATEGQAGVLITRLQAGENFGELALEESADESKSRQGDLGWIAPGHLPPTFVDAVKTLNVGQYTEQPVHTTYGWHVIRLLEIRSGQVPKFDDVKAQLTANLQQARYIRFLDSSLANIPAQ